MNRIWHTDETSPSTGHFYEAARIANLLDAHGFVNESDALRSAAIVIDGSFQTGREPYIEHFAQMGFLDAVGVEKNLPPPTVRRSITLAEEYLLQHAQQVAETADRAAWLTKEYPDLLFSGPGQWHSDVGLLTKVVDFTVDIRPGERMTWVRPVLLDEASLLDMSVGVCDVNGFSKEIQVSLEPQLVELN